MLKNYLAKMKREEGFTLIEMLIYAALLAVVSVVSIAFFSQIVSVTESSRRSREALDNAQRALDVITQEVRNGTSIYSPTSVFVTNPGQLSLETTRDASTDEDSTYVDFYIDDQRLYIKREEEAAQLVTSEKVRVTSLVFTKIDPSSVNPQVRIQITVVYADNVAGTGGNNSVSLDTTAEIRSY